MPINLLIAVDMPKMDGIKAAKLITTVSPKTGFAEQYSLTDLELRVLRLVTEGLSNAEIGQLTDSARETIKGHLKSLFRKLDVKNRTEAAVMAIRDGLK